MLPTEKIKAGKSKPGIPGISGKQMRLSGPGLVLLLLFLLGLSLNLLGAEKRYLLVKSVFGNAQYKTGSGAYKKIRGSGQRLYSGTKLRTGAGSMLKVVFSASPDSELLLKGATTVSVGALLKQAEKYSTSFKLHTGRLKAAVSKVIGGDFSVRTKTAVAGVRGTVFGVSSDGEGESTVYVFEGEVKVQKVQDEKEVGAARMVSKGKKIRVLQEAPKEEPVYIESDTTVDEQDEQLFDETLPDEGSPLAEGATLDGDRPAAGSAAAADSNVDGSFTIATGSGSLVQFGFQFVWGAFAVEPRFGLDALDIDNIGSETLASSLYTGAGYYFNKGKPFQIFAGAAVRFVTPFSDAYENSFYAGPQLNFELYSFVVESILYYDFSIQKFYPRVGLGFRF